jgi:hypothetical protein
MNLREIRDEVRNKLADNSTGTGSSALSGNLWSDKELNRYINKAVEEAAIRSRCILDSTTPACSEIDVTAGTDTYSVHPSVFYIERVYDTVSFNVLTPTDRNALDRGSCEWANDTGTPTSYIADFDHFGTDSDGNRAIRLYPTPDADTVLQLSVLRLPLEPLQPTDSPEIPSYQHYDLVYWALKMAYEKHDADTFDPALSKTYGEIFESIFGPRPTAKALQWGKQHKITRVRGHYF